MRLPMHDDRAVLSARSLKVTANPLREFGLSPAHESLVMWMVPGADCAAPTIRASNHLHVSDVRI